MAIQIPSLTTPVVDKDGNLTIAWANFFTRLLAAPSVIAPVTVGASPFTYNAPLTGSLVVQGGTVSTVRITRGAITLTFTSFPCPLPLGIGDSAVITYTVLPTIFFLPG